MKKIAFGSYILFAILLIFTFNAFGKPITYEGPIDGLVFLFYPEPLPLNLPGVDTDVMFVMVETSGREHIVITPSGRYNYSAKLEEGAIYAWESVEAITDDDGNIIDIVPEGIPIVLDMKSGKLNEHFKIEGPIPDDPLDVVVPDDVDLYFKANLVIDGETVKYQLKVKNGQVLFIKPQ